MIDHTTPSRAFEAGTGSSGRIRSRAFRLVAGLLAAWGVAAGGPAPLAGAERHEAVEARLAQAARYLASDELEGRGIGTKGIDRAADFIAAEFARAGLTTGLFDGRAFQEFSATTSAKLGPNNQLELTGPADASGKARTIELRPGKDFNPLSLSGSGELDLALVFAGYGISGEKEEYDDYAGIEVKGKAVVLLRHEPQQDDPESVFAGTSHSQHAPFVRKVSNAFQHGAAAVIVCSDQHVLEKNAAAYRKAWYAAIDKLADERARFKAIESPTEQQIEEHRKKVESLVRRIHSAGERLQPDYDPLVPFGAGMGGGPRRIPVVYCRRAAVEQVVKAALGKDLGRIEEEIDRTLKPQSAPLRGWRVRGQIDVEREEVTIKNVVGVLEAGGPLAHETIVVGAHYDHLGYGGHGSLEPSKKAIHNGADDNASGVAVMLEVARGLATHQPKLKRRVVFVAFTGEERGLLGSSHYVRNPPFPLEKTVAMINFDMVGRLRDEKLIAMGTATGKPFDELLDRVNAVHGLKLVKTPGGFGPSDQAAFYAREIPVLHFFTGTHKDYHRPRDDFETLNVPGMRRIALLATDLVRAIADLPAAPEYVAVPMSRIRSGGDRPYLGTIPDFGKQADGYAISGVAKGGPAERAGLEGGDVIIRFGDARIGGLEDIDGALRKHAAGDRVRTVVLRDGEEKTFEITLDPPR